MLRSVVGRALFCLISTGPSVAIAQGSAPTVGRSVANESAPSLQSIRSELLSGEVRISIQTQGFARCRDFTLQNPDRVVLDFPGVRSALGARTVALMANSYVRRIRVGEPDPGVTRVVLDTTSAVSYRVVQDDSMVLVSVGLPATETRPRTIADNTTDTPDQEYHPRFGNVPRVEVFGGYSFLRADFTHLGHYDANGGTISTSVNMGRYLGMSFDFSTVSGSPRLNSLGSQLDQFLGGTEAVTGLPGELDFRSYTLMTGPRLAVRSGRMTSYLHALVGAAHVDYENFNKVSATVSPVFKPLDLTLSGRESTSIAAAFGGGFDLQVTPALSLRLVQAEYLMTHFQALVVNPGTAQRIFQNNIRFSTGLVLRFGEAAR
ncbi:MAG TPA: AMIN domain-containing protein [Blastocatellia bacterium]